MAVQTTRNLPAQFVEDLGKDLAEQVVAQSGVPVVTTGLAGLGSMAQPTQQSFETAEQFKTRQGLFDAQRRAALGFEQRQQALSGLAPQIAGLSQREQDARTRATQGLGSFEPFIQAAQASTGPQAFEQFMSPYQQQVIDTSLAEFDRQAAQQRQTIRDRAAVSGAFGGGREGVALSEYDAASDRNRAALQAGLLQQGFGQAQAAAQQNFANQMGLAGALPGLQRADVSTLGQLGAVDRSLDQAGLDAQREATRQATFLPQEQLDRFAGQVTGIMGGYPAQFQTTNVPNPTPLQSALGIGSTLAGIYGTVRNAGAPTTVINTGQTQSSDIRLKTDIKLTSKSPSGINIYSFKYKGDDKIYEGVMAQEVPWASSIAKNGYLQVDYSKVDVQFKRLN